jgi:hypothetical protein
MLDTTTLDPAQDPAIDHRTRAFLEELNKDSSPFWELPGDVPRKTVTSLQDRTPVDLSGITIDERELTVDGRSIALYVVRPAGATALSADLDTESYRAYAEGRFLPRAFMEYGWEARCAACRRRSSRRQRTTYCATRARPTRASSTRPASM